MSRIGQFKEVIGSFRDDLIKARDREVAYGRAGNDRLVAVTDPLLGTQSASVLVGGSGSDTYVAAKRGVTVIFDNGKGDESNTVVAKGIGLRRRSSFVLEVDNRHLLAGDTQSGQIVIAIDWKKPRNRIGPIELSDGKYSYGAISQAYKSFPGYLGNFSWEKLEDSGFLNLNRVGLSSSKIDNALQAVANHAAKL
jgi:hypothetical protein